MEKLFLVIIVAFGFAARVGAQPGTTVPANRLLLHSCRPENPVVPAGRAGPVAHAAAQATGLAPQVRLVYLVPSDRTVNPTYAAAIANAAHDLQRFYQVQLGNTRTFTLHSPVVETFQTMHNAAWYRDNPNGGTFAQFYFNAAQDAFAALGGGGYNDPNYVYAIYIDDESACGQCGGCGGSGVLVVGSNDLRGLVGQPSIRYCATDPEPVQYSPCRWVGGLGHELGHAFGLPHPPGCDNGLSTCDFNDLMWTGYALYPATYLSASEQAILNQGAFFTAQGPAAAPISCNGLLASRQPAKLGPLTVSPNPVHAAAIVQLPASSEPLPLALTDALGREVRRYPVAARATEATLDLLGLPAGLYVLRYGSRSQKLLVE